jgi:plasmid stability protein
MASIQIRDVDPALIEKLKELAAREKRSLGRQILYILERHLEGESLARHDLGTAAARVREFWLTREQPAAELNLPDRAAGSERDEQIQKILRGDS